jgi:hypothetical protein
MGEGVTGTVARYLSTHEFIDSACHLSASVASLPEK